MYKHFSFLTLLVIIQIALAAWFCNFLASTINSTFPLFLLLASLFLSVVFYKDDNELTIKQISERYSFRESLNFYFSFFFKTSVTIFLIILILFGLLY